MFKNRILAAILAITLVVTSLSVLNGVIDFRIFADGENLVVNGDIEEGGKGWGFANNNTRPFAVDTTKTGNGTKCMTTSDDGKSMIYQTVAVEKNTVYTFAVDVYNDSDSTSDSYIRLVPTTENTWDLGSGDNNVMDDVPSTNGEWKTITETLATGNKDYLCFVVILNVGTKAYFDNFKIVKGRMEPVQENTNLVTNGDLEARGKGWSFANNFTTAMAIDDTKTGDGTNCMTTGDAKTMVYQTVLVERNTVYTFSVDVYNDSSSASASYIRLVPTVENTWDLGSADNNVMDDIPSTNGEWETVTKVINTGNNDYLCFVVILNTGTKGYFDNFKIVKGRTEPVQEGANLITNGDLEARGKGWSFANNFTTSMAIDDTKTGDGTNCMTTGDAKTMVYQTVLVERNTEYTFAVDVYNDSSSASASYIRLVPTTENTWDLGSSANNVMDDVPSTNGEWQTITKIVNTGDKDYLCFVVILNTGTKAYFDNFKIVKGRISTGKEDQDLVTNGNLEERAKGWAFANNLTAPMAIDDTKTGDGTNCMTTGDAKTMVYQTVPVDKNTDYIFAVDVYNDSSSESASYIRLVPTTGDTWDLGSSDNNVMDDVPSTNGEWQTVTKVVNTGDNGFLCFVVILNTGTKAYFDNFKIYKGNKLPSSSVPGESIIVNGDFSDDMNSWSGDADFFAVDKTAGKDGGSALRIKSGFHKIISQELKLRSGTYKIAFDYKGTIPEGKIFWGIGKEEASLSSHKVAITQSVPSASNWKHYSEVFNVGATYSTAQFMLQSTIGCDVVVDNITLEPIDETPTVSMDFARAWVIGPVYENLAEMFLGGPAKDCSMLLNGDFTTTSNEPYNNAMKYIATDNDKNGEACAKIVSGDYDVSHFEDSSIKITAGSNEEIVSIPLKLEPNKTYCFGFMGKSDDFYAKNGEFTRFTYGVADGTTGNYLTIQDLSGSHNWKQYQDYFQFLGINDGKWHWNAFSIKTNEQTDFYFQFRATHATVYLDRIAVWDPIYSTTVETNSPLSKIDKKVEVITEEPTLLGIKAGGTNLVQNFNFDDAIDTYWSDSSKFVNYMYGQSLNIVDTGDANRGSSLYYEPNVLYPHHIYYFKWIDVEPNTEYTFSAKYLITKTGKGSFGLVTGYNAAGIEGTWDSKGNVISENQIYPEIFKEYSFGAENYLEEQSWQTVGVTFNSKDLNRVGIFVKDSGGAAYMDDFRLFKTSDAGLLEAESSDFPTELVPQKTEISVKDGLALGFTAGTKLSDVVSSFQREKSIKIYDANNKLVTDLNRIAETGMEIRLMNGPQIAARAKIVIKGDVNGDGLVDAKDIEAIIKHLSYEKLIENDVNLSAADYNSDGKVNIYDTNFNDKAAKEGKLDFALKGPEKFAVGDEIEISLLASENNLRGLSGKLKYNSSTLTFVSAALDISGNWVLSVDDDKNASEVNFYAADTTKNSGTEKGKEVITFTFKVGQVQKYSDIMLQLAELFSTSGADLLSSAEYIWTPGKAPTLNNDNNEGTTNQGGSQSGSQSSSSTVTPGGPTEEVVKAKNRLSELRLDGIKISPEFDPEIKEYTATVPFSVDKVKVIAVAEDANATVTIGKTDLEYVGRNSVTVKVVSEDGLQRTYRIIVTREAPEKDADTDSDVSTGLPVWAIILIAVGGIAVLGAVVFIIIIAKKRKKD